MQTNEAKLQRGAFSSVGWAMMVYYGIMNAAVMSVVLIQVTTMRLSGIDDPDVLLDAAYSNGWGYLIAAAIGLVVLLFWKGPKFFGRTLWKPGKPMTLGAFASILCIFLSGQMLFSMLSTLQEAELNFFGVSAMDQLESATINSDTISMFLYIGLIAPVTEEILFRGLILRTLEPYGKHFAVLLSAFLFGIFHGNVVQTPYAFVVGLVLGYTAMEYNILWAMVLHMFNNLTLGDTLTRLGDLLMPGLGNIFVGLVSLTAAVAAAVILLINRADVGAVLAREKIDRTAVNRFFTSPGILILLVLMFLEIAAPLVSQLF